MSKCSQVSKLYLLFPRSLYCCRHCYTTESRSWHHGSQNKVILCDDCRIYYKKYGKLPATDETREPPPYMFKGVAEREVRDEDGYLVNGKLALRSRRAIPPVQTTLRSGRNKTSSPVEGNTFVLLTHLSASSTEKKKIKKIQHSLKDKSRMEESKLAREFPEQFCFCVSCYFPASGKRK